MTAPSDTVSISRSTSGPAGNPSQAAAIFAVIGTAVAGTAATPFLARNDADPSAIHTGGPLPEVAEIVSSYSRAATIPVRAATATPGAYGTIDTSDFAGTAVPTVDASTIPYISSNAYIIFDTGGALGVATDGITYRASRDGGLTFGARTALGSSGSITIPVANAKIDLAIPVAQVTSLIALLTELRTDRLAHYPYITGSVHLAADNTSGSGVAANPTNAATCITMVNTLRIAELAHATNNTAHTSDDDESYEDMPGPATNIAEAAILANFIKSASAVHNATVASVHGAADAAHQTAAADVTTGNIVAGDIVQVATTAPTLDATGLDACFTALAAFKLSKYGGVAIVGAFDPAVLWASLITGLGLLRSTQIPVIAVIEARPPTDEETPTTYRLALEAEWAAYHDERVYVIAGKHGRYDPATLARCGAQLRRSPLAPIVARLAALDFGESPGLVAASERSRTGPSGFGGPLAGYRMYDDSGNLVGHDESANPGLQPAGFGVVTSFRNVADPMKPYIFQPLMRAPSGNRAPHIAHQRVLAVVESVIFTGLTEEIETGLLYEPGRDTIRADIADGLDGKLEGMVLKEVGDPAVSTSARISRLEVNVDRNAAIDPAAPVVSVAGELDTRFYVGAFEMTLNVNNLG